MFDQLLNSFATSFFAPDHAHSLPILSHHSSNDFLFGDGMSLKLSTVSLYSSSAVVMATGSTDKVEAHEPVEGAFATLVSRCTKVCITADAILIGSMMISWGLPCDAHLISWATGAVLLSFPSSYLVDRVSKDLSFRKGFFLESTLNVVSFAWLCYGFVLMGNGAHCVDTAPLLWWPAFSEGVLGMSITGTGIFCLITATVLSLAFGAEPPSKN